MNANFPADQITPWLIVSTGFPEDSLTTRGQAPRLISFNPDFPSGYTQQWNLNIQRQLPGDTLLEVAYVGSNSIKLQIPRNVNQPRPGPDPPQKMFPALGEVQHFEPMGTSNYHSLQARVEKRYTAGLAFLVSYTLGEVHRIVSHSKLPGPCRETRTISIFRAGGGERQTMPGSALCFLIPTICPWAHKGPSPTRDLAELSFAGWQLSGILAAQTGLPFTVAVGRDLSNTQLEGFNARPNRIGNGLLPKSQRTVERCVSMSTTSWCPRNIRLATPGAASWMGRASSILTWVSISGFL